MDRAGVLVAKKKLFKNKVPNGSGGGAVFFVSRKDHRYLKVNMPIFSSVFLCISKIEMWSYRILNYEKKVVLGPL